MVPSDVEESSIRPKKSGQILSSGRRGVVDLQMEEPDLREADARAGNPRCVPHQRECVGGGGPYTLNQAIFG